MIRTFGKYLLFCSFAVLAACSGDLHDIGGDLSEGYSRIRLSLCAEPDGASRAVRSDANAVDGEMMKSALVVMVNNETDKVERIIPVNMEINMENPEYERHDVGYITVENGPYTFYSFANIPYSRKEDSVGEGGLAKTEINGLTFEKGLGVPAGLEESTWTTDYNGLKLASLEEGIPMSNEEEYSIDNSKSITLHLFRMLSKVRFEFTNKTGSDIKIKKVVLGELTENGQSIFFLPPKNGESIINSFPGAVRNDSLAVYESQSEEDYLISAGALKALPAVYVNESVSQHPTGQMPLHITMERKGGDGEVIDQRYALLQLSNIPRNALAVVPVSLTDYVMKLEAFFYPPIGGYPPYSIEQKKEEFYCRFSGAGDFVLRPFVYKYEDRDKPENWIDLNDRTKVSSYTLEVNDPTGIFSENPAFASTGEILGTLNGNSGRATVCLTVNLLTGDTPVVQVYTRTIHIIVS